MGTAGPYRWALVSDRAPFAPRDGAGALTLGGRMWLLGGWNPRGETPCACNSEVWCSRDGVRWRCATAEAPWEGRHAAGWVVHEERLWVIGGDANQGYHQRDIWSSRDGVSWDRVLPEAPWGPRCFQHTYSFEGRLWVMGGQTMPEYAAVPEIFYDDIWCSEEGRQWTRLVEHAPWPPRGNSSVPIVFDDRLWIIGGGTYNTPQHPDRRVYNDVWHSADGVTWERAVEHAPWAPREFHDVAAWDGRLWVLGGWSGESRSDVWHSADGVHWEELPGTPWAPRHGAGVFVHREALWVVAGSHLEADVWRLERAGR